MKQALWLILGACLILGAIQTARSQTAVGPSQPTALVCAYNAGGPPSPIAGSFYYVQCNSSGQIVVE